MRRSNVPTTVDKRITVTHRHPHPTAPERAAIPVHIADGQRTLCGRKIGQGWATTENALERVIPGEARCKPCWSILSDRA